MNKVTSESQVVEFVRQAHRLGTPVVVVNRGTTRGDDLATVKLDLGVSEFLEGLYSERSRIVDERADSFSTTGAGTGDSTSITA